MAVGTVSAKAPCLEPVWKVQGTESTGGTRVQREERVEELMSGPGEEGKWHWYPAQTTVLPSREQDGVWKGPRRL